MVNNNELAGITPNAIRVARYLNIVNKLLEKNPIVLSELEKYSKEYRYAKSNEEPTPSL